MGLSSPSLICGLSYLPVLDVAVVMALAQQYIPDAQLVEDIGREAVINLPHAASEDGSLALFLNELDKRQGEFGVVSYGLSDTTLEEVRQF